MGPVQNLLGQVEGHAESQDRPKHKTVLGS